MEFYVSRAMQVAMLSEDQLREIHEREAIIRRCLSPWEIAWLTKSGEIKDFFGIPNDPEDQAKHRARIQSEIIAQQLLKQDDMGLVNEINIPSTHQFDDNVLQKKNIIDFSYKGKGKKFNIKEAV